MYFICFSRKNSVAAAMVGLMRDRYCLKTGLELLVYVLSYNNV